jgi:hypothetical protein
MKYSFLSVINTVQDLAGIGNDKSGKDLARISNDNSGTDLVNTCVSYMSSNTTVLLVGVLFYHGYMFWCLIGPELAWWWPNKAPKHVTMIK